MGCVGEQILGHLMQQGITLKGSVLCNCGTGFVPHGTIQQLQRLCGLDDRSLVEKAKELFGHGG